MVNAAISDYNGIIPFYISNADTISTTSRDWIEGPRFTGHYSWSPPINVPCFTLDSLIVAFGKPDFIKLDVEGSELEAVSGLSEAVCELCFEWAEESYDKILKTIDRLKVIGYTQFGYILCDNYLEQPTNWGTWESLEFDKVADPARKEKWGMIFAR